MVAPNAILNVAQEMLLHDWDDNHASTLAVAAVSGCCPQGARPDRSKVSLTKIVNEEVYHDAKDATNTTVIGRLNECVIDIPI